MIDMALLVIPRIQAVVVVFYHFVQFSPPFLNSDILDLSNRVLSNCNSIKAVKEMLSSFYFIFWQSVLLTDLTCNVCISLKSFIGTN